MNCSEKKQMVDLSCMDKIPVLKSVILRGSSGTMTFQLGQYLGASEEEIWWCGAKVMQGSYDSTFVEKLEITVIGYQDGVLCI